MSAAIALAGIGGAVAVTAASGGGTAPGNGEMIFDQPGCGRYEYDGPGRRPRVPPARACPAPTPVILIARSEQRGGTWLFELDGSRSFDRVGGRIVSYRWQVGTRQLRRTGSRITLALRSGRSETVSLAVADDSGADAATSLVLNAP